MGKELKKRYVGSLLPTDIHDASKYIFCRSTKICRTIQSARALLAGMYKIDSNNDMSNKNKNNIVNISRKNNNGKNKNNENSSTSSFSSTSSLPYITTRQKSSETLYPHADGPCLHLSERRIKLYHHYVNASKIIEYGKLESRLLALIGSSHKRIGWLTWLNILDVFTCYVAHGIPLPRSFYKKDLYDITRLVAWTWDVLYAVGVCILCCPYVC